MLFFSEINDLFREVKFDIGRKPGSDAFGNENDYDVWSFDWTFKLHSISASERYGNGVHIRIPFTFMEAGRRTLFLYIFINDYAGYGLFPPHFTIGKEYPLKVDIK